MPSGVMESKHGDNVETSEKTGFPEFSKESTGKSREKKRKKQKKQKNSKTSDAKDMTTATTATSGFGDPALIKSLSLEVARPSVHRQVQRTVRGAA
jgi:hypothetical protein